MLAHVIIKQGVKMSDGEKKETIADKAKEGLASATAAAKEQFDALKTKEGREELKNKAKEGVQKAKDLWNAASIVQRVVILSVAILATFLLTRSCSSAPAAAPAASAAATADKKNEAKFDGSVDLAKADDKTDSMKTFLGFKFGAKADEFKDVSEKKTGETVYYYIATPKLKSKFRLFDFAVLQFTRKDKRLYKITVQTKSEAVAGCKPTAILREAQYCAAMIERKYGQKFNLVNQARLYSVSEEQSTGHQGLDLLAAMAGGIRSSGETAKVIGSAIYSDDNRDSKFAIAPSASYHGFFNNTIEITCTCGTIGGEYLGITIEAMDHGVIEEEGGRTNVIKFDADDDEGKL